MMTSPLIAALFLAGNVPSLGPVPSGTVRLYLVRHTEAYVNMEPAPKMPPEQMDALTPNGRTHAEVVAASLRGHPVAQVLHSPVERTRETAGIIGRVLGAPLRAEARLARIENGTSASGNPLELGDRVLIWQMGRDTRPKDGESLVDVGERVVALAHALRTAQPGTGIAGVTHSEVIAAFLGHLEGTPGAARYPPRVPLGSVTVVELDPGGSFKVLVKKHEP